MLHESALVDDHSFCHIVIGANNDRPVTLRPILPIATCCPPGESTPIKVEEQLTDDRLCKTPVIATLNSN